MLVVLRGFWCIGMSVSFCQKEVGQWVHFFYCTYCLWPLLLRRCVQNSRPFGQNELAFGQFLSLPPLFENPNTPMQIEMFGRAAIVLFSDCLMRGGSQPLVFFSRGSRGGRRKSFYYATKKFEYYTAILADRICNQAIMFLPASF